MRTGFNERQRARHAMRHEAVRSILVKTGVRSVIDLGCGDGLMLEKLANDTQFTQLTGVDQDEEALKVAASFIDPIAKTRTNLKAAYLLGSLLELPRNTGWHEAVTMVEVIEHLPTDDLSQAEMVVFDRLRPTIAVVTTPVAVESGHMPTGHSHGHAFEWTTDEAAGWANGIADRHDYTFDQQIISTYPLTGLDIQVLSFESSR